MKNVKSTLKVLLILVLGFAFNMSMAQTVTVEKKIEKKGKKINLQTVKVINGEKVKWDTTIIITDENKEEVEKYLEKYGHDSEKMSVRLEMLDDKMKMKLKKLKEHEFELQEIHEMLEGEEGLKKKIEVIVKMANDMKSKVVWSGKDAKIYTVKLGDSLVEIDEDEIHRHIELAIAAEDGIIELRSLKEGNKEMIHELMKIHEGELHELKELHKDGKAFAYFINDGDSTMKVDFDHYFDMENNFVFEISSDHDKDLIWVDENGKHKNIVKRMKFGSKGETESTVMFFGEDAHADFSIDMSIDNELDEDDFAVLKKAGIKVKSNELAVDKLRLTYEDDSFALIFKVKTEGKTSIKVVNSTGEVIFTDKVQYFPGTYHKSIGLDSENKGSYFIYIEQGGAGFCTKIHLN